jgi:epoxyqueuosine reductase QueG
MTTADPKEIKQRAVARGLRLGAADVRVVAARADEESRQRMETAFRRGDFAAWGYDGEYARRATDPTSLLQGARSVVCVAVPYATPPPNETAVLRGRVSNYAWGLDFDLARDGAQQRVQPLVIVMPWASRPRRSSATLGLWRSAR